MTKRIERLLGLLQESRLVVDTGRLSRDFEPLRQAIRDAVGQNFGAMLVMPGFSFECKPHAVLSIRCKGFSKMTAEEFREHAEQVVVDHFRQEPKVRVGTSFVEWTVALEFRKASKDRFAVRISEYTLENFLAGEENRFTQDICLDVARYPCAKHNPLVIWGVTGLGKTHLLHAIGNRIQQDSPDKRIVRTTAESFVNELIEAIRCMEMEDFREKYRSGCDVLLMDDVHFISGKTQIQDELFHTFNDLHMANCQIVTTTPIHPEYLQDINSALRLRLAWGIIVEIKRPSAETRLRIIQSLSLKLSIDISQETIEYLAGMATENIVELERRIKLLAAWSEARQKKITIEIVHELVERG